ncbi:MAG: hypothetical protein GY813_14460 [Halieaceae bacterium]|nr:hypothetical protein [Halieaceae bacterium]
MSVTTSRASRPRGDIGLGDLARALVELDLGTARHLHLAAYSLGFEGLAHPESGKPRVAADAPMRKPSRHKKESAPRRRFSAPAESETTARPVGDVVASTLDPLPPLAAEPAPDWLQPVVPESKQKNKVVRKRLLPRNRAAGVLKAALAVRRSGRRLDVPRLIDRVISGKPLLELPYLPAGSLERGVDLLCDYSESMQPFYADLENLGNSLQKIMGGERCRVFEYDIDPMTAIAWTARDEPVAWAPVPGRPVLLATDFGRGSPQGLRRRLQAKTWRSFLTYIERNQVPLLAWSPLPPATLPRWLGHETKIIHWDPRTRAGAVSRLIGIGHEIGF